MAIIKSPGQKRKTRAQIIVVVFFLAVAFIVASATEFFAQSNLKWVDGAASTNATVTSISEETEEYRNRKGRKRYRERVWLEYKFEAEGVTVSERVDVSNVLEIPSMDKNMVVLYQPGNPQKHKLEYQVNSTLNEKGLLSYVISTLPFSGGAAYVLYIVLNLLWVKESKKTLPEGFYNETSWLDVDDKYVVAVDNGNLICFDIHKKRVRDVQEAFQSDESVDKLIQLSKHSSMISVPLTEVTKVSTDHNSDVIYITHDETEHALEFLNVKVKTHALKRIIFSIPGAKEYNKRERTRVEATRLSFFGLVIVLAGAWFIDHFITYIIAGFILVIWLIPSFCTQLFDPSTTRSWVLEPNAERN